MSFEITEPLVRKLLSMVDAGLVSGLGDPIPGQMCVEAAISYALGEPHSDGPSCVDPVVRIAKIRLNDADWSSARSRAKGMRRVAIAQLGSKGTIDSAKFVTLLSEYVIREVVPVALRWAKQVNPAREDELERSAVQCERDGTEAAARSAQSAAWSAWSAARSAAESAARSAARSARSAAWSAARSAESAAWSAGWPAEKDSILSLCAALMVRALQECGSPGCDWLWLVDEVEAAL